MKKTFIFINTIISVLCLSVISANAASINLLTASIDQGTKQVTIRGVIDSGGGKTITIKVEEPTMPIKIDYINETTSSANGIFSFSYKTKAETEGTYKITIGGEGVDNPAQTSFVYNKNPLLNPTSASFDKKTSAQADIQVNLILNNNTLSTIKNGVVELIKDTHYEIANNVVAIKKEYLSTLAKGTTSLLFTFSDGIECTFAVTVTDTTSSGGSGDSGGYYVSAPVVAVSTQKELTIEEIIALIKAVDITKPTEASEKLTSIIEKYRNRFDNQDLKNITVQTAINICQKASIVDKEKLSISKSTADRIVGVKTTDFVSSIDNIVTIVEKLKLSMQSIGMKKESEQLKKEIVICTGGVAKNKVTVLLSDQAIAKAQGKSVNVILQNKYMKVTLPYKSLSLKELNNSKKDKAKTNDEIYLGILINKLGKSTAADKSKNLTGQAYEIKANLYYENEAGKIKKENISKFEGRILVDIKYTDLEDKKIKNPNNMRVYTLGDRDNWNYQRVKYDRQNKTASFGTIKCGKFVIVEYTKSLINLKK